MSAAVTTANDDTFECSICFDDCQLSKKITCGCGFDSCVGCVKTYIMSNLIEPNCPECKMAWDIDFQYKHLGKSFVNVEYRKNKEQILFDIEKARFGETMDMIERGHTKEHKIKKLQDTLMNINLQIDEASIIYREAKDNLKTLEDMRRRIHRNISRVNLGIDDDDEESAAVVERRTIPCPTSECRGIMDSKYHCSICESNACKNCHLLINEETSHQCDENDIQSVKMIMNDTKPCPKCNVRIHKIIGCDQMWCTQCQVVFSWNTGKELKTNNIHNPHYIEWNARNHDAAGIRNAGDLHCGGIGGLMSLNRCMIHPDVHSLANLHLQHSQDLDRINMFKHIMITYDFIKTGHFISEDMTTINIGAFNATYECFSYFKMNPDSTLALKKLDGLFIFRYLVMLNMSINETIDYQVNRFRTLAAANIDNTDLRVKYLKNVIDEKKFKSELIKKDKSKNKNIIFSRLFDLYNIVCTERFNEINEIIRQSQTAFKLIKKDGRDYCRIWNISENNGHRGSGFVLSKESMTQICKMLQDMESMRAYVNQQFMKVAHNFGCRSYYISPLMQVRNTMFTLKELKSLDSRDRTFPITFEHLFIR